MATSRPAAPPSKRQDQALGHELPHQPLSARTERGPYRQLALARRGPREQQIRQVRAGEKQQAQARAAERHEHQAESGRHVLPHPEEADPGFGVGLRIVAGESSGNDIEIGAGLLERDARFQSRHRVNVGVCTVRVILVLEVQRSPELHVASGKVERSAA